MVQIIGITGTLGAGKGTIVDYLVKKKNYVHFSVRDFITREIKRRNLEVNRDNMVLVGNDLRSKFGSSYIVEEIFKEAEKTKKDCVIESLRTAGEIEALRKKGNFTLFAVDALPEIRFERVTARKSSTDDVSFQKFLDDEKREMTSSDPNKQNLAKCISMANNNLINNGTIEELEKDVEEILKKINSNKEEKYVRPSWDDYFLEIPNTVAKRATCDRGRSGCVIARNKQILVSGYVGSPIGLPHCDEVGHQFKKTIHEDGSITNHCVRTVHAEQNAMCQAAKLGISLEGSTLYCRMTPCRVCAMLIINCGIKRVVCEKKYHAGGESEIMFRDAKVELEFKHEDVMKYDKQ